MHEYGGVIERYRNFIDLPQYARVVTLFEGNTPLIPMPDLGKDLGIGCDLFIKFEGMNPTGSFKDRGMTVAVSEAVGRGIRTIICASTGNTAASAAAYAARAGIKCIVIIPEGKVAMGKLAGAIIYGAKVVQIEGSFDDALAMVVEFSTKSETALVNSLNQYRLEGQKTAAFEICDELGYAPDLLCLPVGNAGNITSYWMGFQQYHAMNHTGLPQILGVQASGSAPLVVGYPIDHPETIATAIRIGKPARAEQALLAAEESKGKIISVTDEEILNMQRKIANHGIWVEPASAASGAGLASEVKKGTLRVDGKCVVMVCTGHGLKDPEIVMKHQPVWDVIKADLTILDTVIKGME
jgi:threonine synthase